MPDGAPLLVSLSHALASPRVENTQGKPAATICHPPINVKSLVDELTNKPTMTLVTLSTRWISDGTAVSERFPQAQMNRCTGEG